MKGNHTKVFFKNPTAYLSNKPSIKIRAEIVEDFLGSLENKNILDIGCGDGSLSMQYLNNNAITFLDSSSSMLDRVRLNIPQQYSENALILNADFEEHQFHEKFDIILCVGVLAHVKDWINTVEKVASLLRNGGLAILQISNTDHIYYRIKNSAKQELDNYGYNLNKINSKILAVQVQKNSLTEISKIKYPVLYPFIRIFGSSFSYHCLRLMYRIKLFQLLGSENVILFRKDDT